MERGKKNLDGGMSTWVQDNLLSDYTSPDCLFRSRFGTPSVLFLRMHRNLLLLRPEVWKMRPSANDFGHSSEVKVLVCIRLPKTGSAATDWKTDKKCWKNQYDSSSKN